MELLVVWVGQAIKMVGEESERVGETRQPVGSVTLRSNAML